MTEIELILLAVVGLAVALWESSSHLHAAAECIASRAKDNNADEI